MITTAVPENKSTRLHVHVGARRWTRQQT